LDINHTLCTKGTNYSIQIAHNFPSQPWLTTSTISYLKWS
jgi:hypothetical protein